MSTIRKTVDLSAEEWADAIQAVEDCIYYAERCAGLRHCTDAERELLHRKARNLAIASRALAAEGSTEPAGLVGSSRYKVV